MDILSLIPLTLHFLGTGGGRFVMISQRRRTAGIRINYGDSQIHLDPGPGALVFSNWAKYNPQKLDGVIVTHGHPDHYGDAEVFIEAMTKGTREKRGVFAAPKSVLSGNHQIGPSISNYHKKLPEKVEVLVPEHKFSIKNITFQAKKAVHGDPDTVGLKFAVPDIGVIGYTSDTGYFPKLGELYQDSRLLILCTMWPRNLSIEKHLNTSDANKILKKAKPNCAVLTHFGMRMLNADPEKEAEFLETETGIPVIAAKDGMKITIGEKIVTEGPRRRDESQIIEG
jgi:ribonuclease BN (tRNA processing enzyme)